jgi:dolichyl-phosphate beta-glucosyltransferase
MENVKMTLIIPMYNESSIIVDTAKTLDKYMSENFDSYEILFSDDGSKDGCANMVRELALPNVRVTGYEQNKGKGSAVRHAMLESKGDIVMFTDADLAYGTEVIGRVADTFEENPDADIVIGSRNISADGYEGYTFIRKLASKVYIKVLCIVGGFKLSDSQCGCKAFRGEAAEKIFSRCEVDGFAFDFEAILWAVKYNMKIAEMPVKIINHRESKVRMLRDTFKMLRDLNKMKRRIKKEK